MHTMQISNQTISHKNLGVLALIGAELAGEGGEQILSPRFQGA